MRPILHIPFDRTFHAARLASVKGHVFITILLLSLFTKADETSTISKIINFNILRQRGKSELFLSVQGVTTKCGSALFERDLLEMKILTYFTVL